MTFSLHLDRTFTAKAKPAIKPKKSVLYRSGYLAGVENRRPNRWSLAQDLYVQGYTAGMFWREVYIALGVFALVSVTSLLTLVLFGY